MLPELHAILRSSCWLCLEYDFRTDINVTRGRHDLIVSSGILNSALYLRRLFSPVDHVLTRGRDGSCHGVAEGAEFKNSQVDPQQSPDAFEHAPLPSLSNFDSPQYPMTLLILIAPELSLP